MLIRCPLLAGYTQQPSRLLRREKSTRQTEPYRDPLRASSPSKGRVADRVLLLSAAGRAPSISRQPRTRCCCYSPCVIAGHSTSIRRPHAGSSKQNAAATILGAS